MNARLIAITQIIFAILTINFVTDCKKEYKGDDPEYFKKIEESQAYLKARIKDQYEISDLSNTKEEAIYRFLEAVQNGQTDRYIFTKEEYINIFLPNTLDENTLSNTMPLEQAWKFTDMRRYIALESLQNLFKKHKNQKFKIETLTWREDVRQLKALKGHRVGNLTISFGNEKATLEEVRLVVEHRGKFKVCVIGT
ncbi:hypothetical protein [Leptospira licerasiae]|uniref:Lipoprotein n=1 Tax=Leptospira licerasiae str. MMD4847 TaxID=1049971 RepID=A0ABN0H938_9LEPT|nr:hypothetical protein [Leptospira licerasiae]EIE00188.1 hypothetical protein LEP1GSC185_2366 [Leptospira licerasiae serovar Varillal str. VAR 010]EJZ42098.1 hypothetical protein LEP1GSC178_0141 [Leptospira licerasiae str. MMD4847]